MPARAARIRRRRCMRECLQSDFSVRAAAAATTVAATFAREPTAVSARRIFADESSRRALGSLGRAGAGRIVLVGAVALGAERRPGRLRRHWRAAGGGPRRAGVALGTQGLRAGALAAGPDPHRPEGPRQPDLGRLRLPRLGAGPHHHQLPRRQRSGAQARAPRPRLRHRRRPRGAARHPPARRPARPRAAARRRRGRGRRGAAARASTRCRSVPPASRSRRASASIRSATRSTSASRSRRAPTTAWCGAASIRRSSSAARSRRG